MRNLFIMFAALVTAYSTVDSAEVDTASLLKCQTEAQKDERLACYDEVLPPIITEDAQTSVGTGKWQITKETSIVDDSENVYISLPANESIRLQFGESVTPVLSIRCQEKKTDLLINWDTYLGSHEKQVLYRLDKQNEQKTKWNISKWDILNDSKAVFYHGNPIEFIQSLAKASKLLAMVKPYNDKSVSATFDLAGLPEALKSIQDACNWK
ncbi:hypothetical protein GTGU_03609 [Trabulsiella guamensis ATCC 49490]|uniref:Uncharacterized protein n=1 Tax=Trabulsiella guamensis ATCC 49490 TaxID=1005994 RepID=A0A084ZU08_9ENTR|nr:type VI secretion system-associated protein TagO [Trabulsiella guamensis]KFC00953.1 hypothetical protein GTGU_03609 [Trabulsiella guamensis ATCC 49490]